MDDQTERAPARARVRFGPKPTQTLPFEWAEKILANWAHSSPSAFGSALRTAVMEDLPPVKERKADKSAEQDG